MEIYLSSRFSRLLEMKGVAFECMKAGHTVSARWLDEAHDATLDGYDDDMRARICCEDLEDIANCDLFVGFTEAYDINSRVPATLARGGRHVELGVALALDKKVAIVGPRENAFHYDPRINAYLSVRGLIKAITV